MSNALQKTWISLTFPPRTSSPIIRHAAVWMGFAFAADVIADGPGRGTRNGVVAGRDEPNGRGKWRVIRLSLLSMKGLYKALGSGGMRGLRVKGWRLRGIAIDQVGEGHAARILAIARSRRCFSSCATHFFALREFFISERYIHSRRKRPFPILRYRSD